MSYLGIDVGTSAVKAVLIDGKQQCIAEASVPLNISRPYELWSEQDPNEWWRATCAAIDQLKQSKRNSLAAVQAIGLTGQMHGATCLDANNQILRPAILWNDGRSYLECESLNKHPANFLRVNGNTVMPGFTAPKILWLQKNEPNVFKKIAKVLLPKDFIRFKLSGEYATDLSDASGTSWLDVGKRCWSEELLAATGLSLEHMAKVYEGPEITGTIDKSLARRWDMLPQVKIVAGAGDNAAGAVSLGIIHTDRAMLSLGTSGVYFVPTKQFNPDPTSGFHAFCHCLPHKWHQMGVILSAASCMSWLREILLAKEAELITAIQANPLGDIPIFLPYLSGERTPHNNPFAKGVMFGMTHNTGRSELTQAVLEGVAFAIADCQEVLAAVGTKAEHISMIGGGARSKYWGEIIAAILNKPLSYHNESTLGPAFGAARLAIIGDTQAAPEKILTLPRVTDIIYPQKDWLEFYQQKFVKFRKLYQYLKPLFTGANL